MHSINSIFRKIERKHYMIVLAVALITLITVDIVRIDEKKESSEEKIELTNFETTEAETETAFVETDPINIVMGIMAAEQQEKVTEVETEITEPETTEPETTINYVISFSDEDYNNLLRIVEAEATGGDIKSKILVADVVINRVRDSHFPNTITEVVFQENGRQFQPIADGRFYSVSVTESTYEAVNRALQGEDYSMGATFFASVSCKGGWHARTLQRLFEYGGHIFYAN